MGTVVIGAVTFQVYGTLTGAGSCDEYLSGSLSSAAVAWRALVSGSDDQKRTLVEAARILNTIAWQGTPTQAYPSVQPLAWPRAGVVVGGVAVSSASIPQDIINGSYELAAAIALNTDLAAQLASGGDNVKSMKADGAAVDYWTPQQAGSLPGMAAVWLAAYFAIAVSSQTAHGFSSSGTDTESTFDVGDDGDDYALVRPL